MECGVLGLYVFVIFTFLCDEGEKWDFNWWLHKSSIFGLWVYKSLGVVFIVLLLYWVVRNGSLVRGCVCR